MPKHVPPATTRAILAALTVSLLLSACTTPTARRDESSPYFAVPAGSTLRLHRVVEILPTTTRTWIQNGDIVPGRNRYAPNCSLEVRKRDDDNVQTVQPGTFVVRRTQFLRDEVVRLDSPVMVASAQLHLADSVDSSGPSMVYEGYHLWLESEEQPNVMRLTCLGVYNDPPLAKPPSIDEIRAALGSVATLTLP